MRQIHLRALLPVEAVVSGESGRTLAQDDDQAYVDAAREMLAPELTGRHENANCLVSPDGGATLRRPAPQRLDSYASVMDTARAARHRSSRVGRRAEMRPQPSRCSRKRRQKGDDGTFCPAFLRSSTRRKRPRSRRRSRVRSFGLILRTSRRSRVVQKVRVCNAPQTENPVIKRGFGLQDGETRTRTGDTTIFSRAVGDGQTHAIPGNHKVLR